MNVMLDGKWCIALALEESFHRAAEGASVLLQLGHEIAREAQHA